VKLMTEEGGSNKPPEFNRATLLTPFPLSHPTMRASRPSSSSQRTAIIAPALGPARAPGGGVTAAGAAAPSSTPAAQPIPHLPAGPGPSVRARARAALPG